MRLGGADMLVKLRWAARASKPAHRLSKLCRLLTLSSCRCCSNVHHCEQQRYHAVNHGFRARRLLHNVLREGPHSCNSVLLGRRCRVCDAEHEACLPRLISVASCRRFDGAGISQCDAACSPRLAMLPQYGHDSAWVTVGPARHGDYARHGKLPCMLQI